MKERRNAGHDGCSTIRMQDKRDAWKIRIKERRNAGQVRCRTGESGKVEKKDAGQVGGRGGGADWLTPSPGSANDSRFSTFLQYFK